MSLEGEPFAGKFMGDRLALFRCSAGDVMENCVVFFSDFPAFRTYCCRVQYSVT